MSTRKNFIQEHGLGLLVSSFLLCGAIVFREPLFNTFVKDHYATIHLFMAFFIISSSLTIVIHAWMTFPHTLSIQRTWMGALFLNVGLFEIFHALTYSGMLLHSPYHTTWYYMISRLTLAIGLFIILLLREHTVQKSYRWIVYAISILHACLWIFLISFPAQLLPEIVMAGTDAFSIKDFLQIIMVLFQLLCIGYILYTVRRSHHNWTRNIMILIASVYLIGSDLFLSTFLYVDNSNNFLVHLFQLASIYYLLRAIYYTAVKEPFHQLYKNEAKLKTSKHYLHAITSQIGEGIIVINKEQKITFINPTGARLLKWQKNEILNKDFHEILSGSKIDLSSSDVKNIVESQFKRKDGSTLPVSYVMTPFVKDRLESGNILVFRDMTESIKQQEHITYLAYYNERTKLPNYRYFQQQVAETIQQNPKDRKAVFMLDIEQLHTINESLGPETYGFVIEKIASRLKTTLSKELLIGTRHEKQFMVFLKDITNEEQVKTLCDEIQAIFSKPIHLNHLQLNISTNIGIALYPEHGNNEIELLKNAQMAAYNIQTNEDNTQFFDPLMNEKRLERLILENDLYTALENDELYLEYQPQVDLKTGKVKSVETLVRWQHPTRGFVSPGQFIPLAEETGLIVPIGEWVLKESCQQLKKWHAQGLHDLKIAVNVSSRQFYQQNLLEKIKKILHETSLSPTFLELEITESVTINVDNAKEVLEDLKDLGISIAMDDFGTGYSSLHYLNQFPIDRLKIDRSFIHNIQNDHHNAALCTMIIAIANHLHIDVVAEGIEEFGQLEFLWQHDCVHIQGFFFSKPLQAELLTQSFSSIEQHIKKEQQALMFETAQS